MFPSGTDAQEWLELARDDLRTAQKLLPDDDTAPRQSCFLAQQAAEKAIKAALIRLEIEFPYRHNLDQLMDLLPEEWPTKREFPDLARLSQWAVEARYPGDWSMPTKQDAHVAVDEASGVVESIETQFRLLDQESSQ